MTIHPLALRIFAFAIFAAAAISPALAIDCSHATGAVETAICADKDLLKSDARFNRGYSDLIDRLDVRHRQEWIESQKLWLVQRDTLCKAKPPAEVADCVGAAMRRREYELAKKFSDGYSFGQIRLGEAGETLNVGHARLDVLGQSGDMLSLVHSDTLIAESQAPFEVDGRAGDDSGEAVVVSTHDSGSMGCSNQYLLSSLPDRPLRVELLNILDSCSPDFSVKRSGNRLEFRSEVSPGRDGLFKTWSAENGLALERSIEFVPKRGTKMADFHDDGPPTDNEEFFNSLKQSAPQDWRLMAQALQFAEAHSDDTNRKYVVLFPCSRGRGCPVESAFAAYARATKSFFFAFEPAGSRYEKEHAQQIIYYPDRAKWPADIAQIVDDWAERLGE